MNQLVKILPNFKKFNSYIEDVKNDVNPIMLSGLTDVGKVHFAYSTSFYTEKPICIITYNELQARKIIKDLAYFEEDVCFFPKREIFVYDYIAESKDSYYKRIDVLNKIQSKKCKIIVTTAEAIMQKMISRKTLYKNILKLSVGETVNLNELKEKLVNSGYERYDLVESGRTV